MIRDGLKNLLLASGVVLCLLSPVASALDVSDNSNLDLGFKIGSVFGTLYQDEIVISDPVTVEPQVFPYGGILVGVGVNWDLSRNFGMSLGFHFVLDATNVQITRKGLDLTMIFPIWGGVRRTITDFEHYTIMERDSSSLSLLVRVSFQAYNPSNKLDPNDKVDGSIFSNDVGAEYRFDVSDQSSITVSAMYSLLTLSASTTRVSAKIVTGELGWRLYL